MYMNIFQLFSALKWLNENKEAVITFSEEVSIFAPALVSTLLTGVDIYWTESLLRQCVLLKAMS